MAIFKCTADEIHTVSGAMLTDSVIVIDTDTDRIIEISPIQHHDASSVKKFEGKIVPGFINAHCHLELSHLKGIAQTGTGLISFLEQVVKNREMDPEVIASAMSQADQEMYKSGIVAVGDICNKTDTLQCKVNSNMYYHNFVEVFDLNQSFLTDEQINTGIANKKEYRKAGLAATIVPHATYSVSEALFAGIRSQLDQDDIISIHMQETPDENQFINHRKGAFPTFYDTLELPYDHIPARGKDSIPFACDELSPTHNTLFVHNTMVNTSELDLANQWNENLFWVTCPNANLYIENRLPDYRVLRQGNVCIGTDSLTSNWQLSIWEEMKTILKYCSYLDFTEVLKWATWNGARALNIDKDYGSIDAGKKAKLVNIHNEISTIIEID